MDHGQSDHFVRFPQDLLQGLLAYPFTGVQLRILLWVTRHTAGWNRRLAPFSWYEIAQHLHLDRAGVMRAGRRLLAAQVLYIEAGQLGIQMDTRCWQPGGCLPQHGAPETPVTHDGSQRKALTPDNVTRDTRHRNGCLETTLFRRAKDSSKDNLKTYKDSRRRNDASGQRFRSTAPSTKRRHLAGAARPIPGKYDSLSEN